MRVIPAIDLRDGACVQLVGGSYADERVRIADPVAVAENWARLGFGRIHLVDLDAATGRGSNRETVRTILCARVANQVQCGGGVRNLASITELFAAGASEVVLGTRAIEDRPWLDDVVLRYPNRIIVAADTRGRQLVTRGWAETDPRNVIDFIAELGSLPLAAILVTAVDREGRMEGPDLALMEKIILRSTAPLQASGGVRSVEDLRALAELGVSAAVIGMALYTGKLDAQTIIEEFPE
ncbi:MAG TPA: 1-(5-phosphoribosyl)-5-[(5-phosphoribosylamino)methylideneamino] imidazole-4-carboxamide isomerase [Gemmatimonadaceae bacterium]|nr:1-(5-phosphoribosyl)-5-[(5-phosphoribosylamino)methylideneamino] imidazole-4-carboxamide isomerase [Gemmatimonadaceae bacterium]